MSEFNKNFQDVLKNALGQRGYKEGGKFILDVQNQIEDAILALKVESKRVEKMNPLQAKGFIAEQWHAHTFNVNATSRGVKDVYAKVPGGTASGKDIIFGDANTQKFAEVKYRKNDLLTAKDISRPKYMNSEKVVPSDQIGTIPETAINRAERILSKPRNPEQLNDVEYLLDTSKRAKDHIEINGVTSEKLSNKKASNLAEDLRDGEKFDADKYNLNSESFVTWSDIFRQSGEAAINAVLLSAALSTVPIVWNIINEYFKKENIDTKTITESSVLFLNNTANAGLRGGIAAGLTAAFKSGLLGKNVKNISPSAIGVATTMTINVIGYSLQMHYGKISKQEFTNNCIRDTFILSCSIGGASLGQLIIPIPMLGALIGNLLGATLGAVVHKGVNNVIFGLSIENGWTFFGLVEQNYEVPDYILEKSGIKLLKLNYLKIKKTQIRTIDIKQVNYFSFEFNSLSRGVISSNVIGYN
jgi:hypothetical protein